MTTEDPIPRAFLLGLVLGRQSRLGGEESLKELALLVETAGAMVAGQALYKQRTWDVHGALSEGHKGDLLQGIQATRSSLLVVDFDLKPAQARNLSDELEIQVLDRSQVILDIFAVHARTEVARTQVELAQLEYALPRLRHMWAHLSREQGGIGLRGPGEKQIETDRRLMRLRIQHLRRRLETIERRREISRRKRGDAFRVGIVGYTNVGKSSLLNALCGSEVLAKDQLFSTLDPTSRRMKLPKGEDVILTDTVGFIGRLPHHLVNSFHATLSETATSDLLLVVEDMTCKDLMERRQAVETVLDQLGCSDTPRLFVGNKMDLVDSQEAISKRSLPDGCLVSSKTGEGLDELRHAIEDIVCQERVRVSLFLPIHRGDVLASMFRKGQVLGVRYEEDHIHVMALLASGDADRLKQQGFRIE